MGSKAFLFLGLFLAIFLMISSEVIARELAETSNSVNLDNENEVHVDGRGSYNGVGGDERGVGGIRRRCNYVNRCRHDPCTKPNGCK